MMIALIIAAYILVTFIWGTVWAAIDEAKPDGATSLVDAKEVGATYAFSLFWPLMLVALLLYYPFNGLYKLVRWGIKEIKNPKENVKGLKR